MRRKLLAAVLFVFLLAAGTHVAPLIVDSRPACVRAEAWVKANANSLPQTLDELSALPIAYRIRVFDALPPDVKAAVWREQLTRALLREDLDAEQKLFIHQALPWLTAAFYTNRASIPEAIEWRARGLFVQHEHADIMMRLGPDKPTLTGAGKGGFLVGLDEIFRSWFTVRAA